MNAIHAIRRCRTAWRARFAAALALLACAAAQAGRPLVTEDAAVLGDGECTVETFWGRFGADEAPTARVLSSQFACDVGHRTQLSIAAVRLRAVDGHGDALTAAGKTLFAGGQGAAAEWSLAYGAVARRTSGMRMEMDQLYATLVSTVALGRATSAHLNVGWTGGRHPRDDSTRWAVAVETAVSDDLHLVAETFADDRNPAPWLQAGFWVALNPRLSLNGSYGRKTGSGAARGVTLGLTASF